MAGVKISQLTPGGAIQGVDEIPISRAGIESFKILASQVVTDGANVGGGSAQFFADKITADSTTLRFRSLSGDEGISFRNVEGTIVVSTSGQNPIKTSFYGNGSTLTFPINGNFSVNPNNYRVDIDGVLQEPIADYNVVGSNIIFTSAPPLSSKVVVVANNIIPAYDIIPSDGSVTSNKIALSAVTQDKIAPITATGTLSARTLQDRFADVVNVKDFGAKVDGVTDDTAAWNTAFAYVALNNSAIKMPSGTSMVNGLFFTNTNSYPLVLLGDGKGKSIIKKISGSPSGPVFKINQNNSGRAFFNCFITGITFDGNGVGNATAALELNDVWESTFENIICQNSSTGLNLCSNISNCFNSLIIQNNTTGLNITKLDNPYFPVNGIGPTNAVYFQDCSIISNTTCAATIDYCTDIQFRYCMFEVNGTTIGANNQGGIFVGANSGPAHLGTVVPTTYFEGCWSEQNKGIVSFAQWGSGFNVAKNCFLWVTPTDATYDFNILGGNYTLDSIVIASTKTANVNESSSVLAGNRIAFTKTGNFNINANKTSIDYGNSFTTRFITAKASGSAIPATYWQNDNSVWSAALTGSNFSFYNSAFEILTLSFDALYPATDNTKTLGTASRRWSVVYAGTGSINTSDEREKQQIETIDEAVFRAWSKVQFKQFKFSDAVNKKGGQNARIHVGLIAQKVKEAFESEGLDAFKYGLLCYDEWENGNRYGIRYDEALALECAYQRRITENTAQELKQLKQTLNINV